MGYEKVQDASATEVKISGCELASAKVADLAPKNELCLRLRWRGRKTSEPSIRQRAPAHVACVRDQAHVQTAPSGTRETDDIDKRAVSSGASSPHFFFLLQHLQPPSPFSCRTSASDEMETVVINSLEIAARLDFAYTAQARESVCNGRSMRSGKT